MKNVDWDRFFRYMYDIPVWNCSQCGTAFYGLEIEASGLLTADPNRWRYIAWACPKCKHVDPPLDVRTYGPKAGCKFRASSFEDPDRSPYWSKRKPLWTVSDTEVI